MEENQNENDSNGSSDSIVYNNNCIPDEDEINLEIEEYQKELERKKKQEEEEKQRRIEEEKRKKLEEEEKQRKLEEEERQKKLEEEERKKKEEEEKQKKLNEDRKKMKLNLIKLLSSNEDIKTLLLSKNLEKEGDIIPKALKIIKQVEGFQNADDSLIENEIKNYLNNNNNLKPVNKNMNTLSKRTNTSTSSKPSVYERLYDKRKKYEIEIKEHKPRSVSISMSKRTRDLVNKLYNASKRQKVSSKKLNIKEIKPNAKSNAILYKKFFDQFESCLKELVDNNTVKYQDKLDINEYKILLSDENLGFIGKNVSQNEENLINKIFSLLEIESYININNLFIFLLSVLNIAECYDPNKKFKFNNLISKNSTTSSSTNNLIKKNVTSLATSSYFCVVNNNQIIISKYQTLKISKEFQILSSNWKEFLMFKNTKKNIKEESLFKPITNIKYNSKIKGNLFSHISLYKNRKSENDRKIYLQKEMEDKKEMSNCTFAPSLPKLKSNSKSKFRFQSKNRNSLSKSKDDIEYESNIKEFTFKPKINKIKGKNLEKMFNDSMNSNNSYEEKRFINRMNKSRFERQRVMDMTNLRNYSVFNENNVNNNNIDDTTTNLNYCNKYNYNNSNNNNLKASKNESLQNLDITDKDCVLVIDISINNDLKRVYIHKDDKPEEVTEKFILDNDISDMNIIEQIKKIIFNEMSMIQK